MLLGAWLLPLFVFSILGASFLATTAALVWEFKDQVWLDFVAMDSHLFVFFPTLGIVALVAFYVPSSVFVDMYWKYIPFGRIRFFLGFLVVAAASYWISSAILANPRRAIWEMAPAAITMDRGEPSGCEAGASPCARLPVLSALHNLRQVSQRRFGLEGFLRDCGKAERGDPLLEKSPAPEPKRFCFASTPLSANPPLQSDAECCKAQARFISFVSARYADPRTRSFTSKVHAALLPLKVFFLLVLFVIGILLAVHHRKVEQHYRDYLPHFEVGLFVGSISMIFFPLMSQAFVQASEVLNGSEGRGTFSAVVPAISLLFVVWALLIGLFFRRRHADERFATVGRFGGLLLSNIGIIKYNLVISAFAWTLGAGATKLGLSGLVAGSLLAIILTIWAVLAYGRAQKHT